MKISNGWLGAITLCALTVLCGIWWVTVHNTPSGTARLIEIDNYKLYDSIEINYTSDSTYFFEDLENRKLSIYFNKGKTKNFQIKFK